MIRDLYCHRRRCHFCCYYRLGLSSHRWFFAVWLFMLFLFKNDLITLTRTRQWQRTSGAGGGATGVAAATATTTTSRAATATTTTTIEMVTDPSSCIDLREQCPMWAAAGDCELKPNYMLPHCPWSCQVCHRRIQYVHKIQNDDDDENDSEEDNNKTQSVYEPMAPVIRSTSDYKIVNSFAADLGVPQLLDGLTMEQEDLVRERVAESRMYLHNTIQKKSEYRSIRHKCRNDHERCTLMAINDECDSNDTWMTEHCPLACFTCHELMSIEYCPVTRNMRNAWYKGDLDRMFTRITESSSFHELYQGTIISRPNYRDGIDTEDQNANYVIGPWIITLEHFISVEEATRLIEWGTKRGYERSTETDDSYEVFISKARTSTNAWCEDECADDPIVQAIVHRIETMTNIPDTNYEAIQLLKYEEGQRYQSHHDLIDGEQEMAQGPRILTFFIYLNQPEEGGETEFTDLGHIIQPQLGRVVIWPSVLDDDPHHPDQRTKHAALPVIKGVKYAANVWLHQRARGSDC